MWAVAAPVAIATVVLVARRVIRSRRKEGTEGADSEECVQDSVTVMSDAVNDDELMEAGVPLVSDIVGWLEEAAERLDITRKPVVMRVLSKSDVPSICLDFSAVGVEMKLWISGPVYMGPYPRLTRSDNAESSGVVIEERSAVCLERAIASLK
jgi:hypothetical protein